MRPPSDEVAPLQYPRYVIENERVSLDWLAARATPVGWQSRPAKSTFASPSLPASHLRTKRPREQTRDASSERNETDCILLQTDHGSPHQFLIYCKYHAHGPADIVVLPRRSE